MADDIFLCNACGGSFPDAENEPFDGRPYCSGCIARWCRRCAPCCPQCSPATCEHQPDNGDSE